MQSTSFLEVWPVIYLTDLLRYLIPAGTAFLLFWVIGVKWWRHLFIQNDFPKRSQLWKEFAYSMSTVIIFSLVGFCLFMAKRGGLTMIYDNIEEYSILYLVFSLITMIVFHDFYFYWTHRMMHHKAVFKYVHRVHHESTSPSPWAAYSFHPWEALVQALVLPILVFTLPLHPIVIAIFLIYMIVRNVIGHLGFEILPKGFTRNRWLNWHTAVTHHDMHHEYFHNNYGLYFTWWDKIMKTENPGYHVAFDEVKSRPKSCALKATRKKSTAVAMVVFLFVSSAAGQSVAGLWATYNDATGSRLSTIEILQKDAGIEGRVREVFLEPYQGEDPVCAKCADDRKGQKVIGMNFLWGF
jgi:lathosterol oxidase